MTNKLFAWLQTFGLKISYLMDFWKSLTQKWVQCTQINSIIYLLYQMLNAKANQGWTR